MVDKKLCKNKYYVLDVPNDGKSILSYGQFIAAKLCYHKYDCENCKYNPNKNCTKT